MKILHVIAGDLTGGAARGAYWLHQSLLSIRVDSSVIVQKGQYNDPTVFSMETNTMNKLGIRLISKINSKINSAPLRFLYQDRKKTPFSTGFGGNDIRQHPAFKSADIIHLHWINAGMINFKLLKSFHKPIIWTMRDMWPFTGGCHYALDCDKYEDRCGACPQLNSDYQYDLSRWIWKRKCSNLPESLHLVAISNWLGDVAQNSSIFSNYQVKVIPNGIDIKVFKPVDKIQAKKILNLPLDKPVILLGAKNVHDSYKGFPEFIKAVDFLRDKDFHFVLFGKVDCGVLDKVQIPYTNLGSFQDELALRLVYSAADVFVAPSIQEAFGKTLVESMACGTPVVAFNATGPKDIVTHKETGYLATPFEPEDLARGIKWVLEDEERKKCLSQKAREKAEMCFDVKQVAQQYLKLYEEVLGSD